MSVKNIDVWSSNIGAIEYIRMVREAKGPEQLHAVFIEARMNLDDSDYKFLYEQCLGQVNLLLDCGGQIAKPNTN